MDETIIANRMECFEVKDPPATQDPRDEDKEIINNIRIMGSSLQLRYYGPLGRREYNNIKKKPRLIVTQIRLDKTTIKQLTSLFVDILINENP